MAAEAGALERIVIGDRGAFPIAFAGERAREQELRIIADRRIAIGGEDGFGVVGGGGVVPLAERFDPRLQGILRAWRCRGGGGWGLIGGQGSEGSRNQAAVRCRGTGAGGAALDCELSLPNGFAAAGAPGAGVAPGTAPLPP